MLAPVLQRRLEATAQATVPALALAFAVAALLAPCRAAMAQTEDSIESPAGAQEPEANYWVYVANEASDAVSRVRFGPDGATT